MTNQDVFYTADLTNQNSIGVIVLLMLKAAFPLVLKSVEEILIKISHTLDLVQKNHHLIVKGY